MTYEEAKEKVPSAEFNSCYSRVAGKKKRFKELYEEGPYKSVRRTFEDIKNDKEAFRSGDTNLYYELVENYEMDLGVVLGKVIEDLKLAEAHAISIMGGMNTDRAALADALAKEEEVFNSLAPHIGTRVIGTDSKGEPITENYDRTAEDRATAIEEGRKVWEAECCAWSK